MTVPHTQPVIAGLDIGSLKTAVIVGVVEEDGRIGMSGFGAADSCGIRRGVVVNMDAAIDSVRRAVAEAELSAGVPIDVVHLSLSTSHVRSINSRGFVAVAGPHRLITTDDAARAITAATAVAVPPGEEIVDVIPHEFVIDGQDGVAAPVGMTGTRLEVNVHIVTRAVASTRNLAACVTRAGVSLAGTVVEPLAAGEAVLSADERELGVALVDIGGGTTDFGIFDRGLLCHTGVLPIGGQLFTQDVASGLRTPVAEAERIKCLDGCVDPSLINEHAAIDVASLGGRPRRQLPRRLLAEILQIRAEELCHRLWDEICKAGYAETLSAGLVLTGGGSLLDGLPKIAADICDLPVRRGTPATSGCFGELVNTPSFAAAAGIVSLTHRLNAARLTVSPSASHSGWRRRTTP